MNNIGCAEHLPEQHVSEPPGDAEMARHTVETPECDADYPGQRETAKLDDSESGSDIIVE